MQRNIEAAQSADGGNVPLENIGKKQDKLSINELQLHLANQAARLRMEMTSEYEELRRFQNSELEYWLNVKAKSESDFKNEVERARIPPVENVKIPRAPPPRPQHPSIQIRPLPPLQRRDSMPNTSPVVRSPIQPFPSPRDLPDFSSLKNDLSPDLNPNDRPFISFFLDLEVVQHNWGAIASKWAPYVDIFRRNLMTRPSFAAAVLEDVVRDTKRYEVDLQRIKQTSEIIEGIPNLNPIARVIIQVVLDLAGKGIIQFDTTAGNLKGPTFGPNIISNIMKLSQAGKEGQTSANPLAGPSEKKNVGKATDPRQRR